MPVSGGFNSDFILYTASDTFTVPDGVESVFATVIGGGGAGGPTYSQRSGDQWYTYYGAVGGRGGAAVGYLSVTPGQNISVTVGLGGQYGWGGTSTFSTMSGGGGQRGASYQNMPGVVMPSAGASGGSLLNTNVTNKSAINSYLDSEVLNPWVGPNSNSEIVSLKNANTTATSLPGTARITWSAGLSQTPGCAGNPSNHGGVGGAVLIVWGGDIE